MKSRISKFAATACIFAVFSSPATLLADRDHDRGRGDRDKKHWAKVAEPGTLELTLAGLGIIGAGMLVANFRHRRSATV